MPSILDVVYYILEKTGPVTTMKLQKLAYYCQAWSLAWDEVPLFEEDFQAWSNGPVCPELFDRHRGQFVIDKDRFIDHKDFEFEKYQIETIDSVLDFYSEKDPHWLSELTHKEDPWLHARGRTPMGAPSSAVITKESMQQYYGGLNNE